jgi:monoamine oxidase
MKRRKALRNLGLGMAAGFAVPRLLSSCSKEDPGPRVQYDGTVAVIGAGAAGLYTADALNALGINVVVFEASAQLGGRIRSLRGIGDYPLELGAEVIRGSDSSMATLVRGLSIPTVDITALSEDYYLLDNTSKPASEWNDDLDVVEVDAFINSIPGYSGSAVSVQQAAQGQVTERAMPLLNARVANLYGTSSDRLGMVGLSQQMNLWEYDTTLLHLKGNPLQDVILSRFSKITSKVQLNTEIKSVSYAGDLITLTDSTGASVQASKVVVTVPLGVLKAGGISFSPVLPSAKTAALNNLGMDNMIRLILDFKRNFWGVPTVFTLGGTRGPLYFNSGIGRSELMKTLSVTASGLRADELSALGDGMIPAVLEELDAAFLGAASLNIKENPIVVEWAKEPFIKGGVSYPKPAASNADREALAAPVEMKIYFAGEATGIKGDFGTISGAINSADRVVEEIVTDIQTVSG